MLALRPGISAKPQLIAGRPLSAALRQQRAVSLTCQAQRLMLQPSGDGDASHIDDVSALPAASPLELKGGALYELGRVDTADLCVPLPTVSARHAAIRVGEDGSVTVADLGSTNGTYVDGQELKPNVEISLSPGSEVTFGDRHLASFRLEKVDE